MLPDRILLYRLPALAGLLLFLAYLTVPLLPANLVAFLPILAWLDADPSRALREQVRGTFVFGAVAYLLSLHWMYSMLWISWLATLAWLALAAAYAASASAAVVAAYRLRLRTGWSYGLLLPMTWIPLEWIRTFTDLRMTADHLAHSLARYPFLVQFADLTGPYGVGAVMLAINGLLYEAWRHRGAGRGRRAAVALGILIGVVLAYDTWAWRNPPEPDRTLRAAFVQPDVPLLMKWDVSTALEQWERLERLTREAASRGAELVVWPESAVPETFEHWLEQPDTYAIPRAQALARETGTYIVAPSEYYRIPASRRYTLFNAAHLIHPDGGIDPAWTAKVYLVPFVEGVPFEPVLGRILSRLEGGFRWLSGGFTAPDAPVPLPVGDVRLGVLVCFEGHFFDLTRRVRLAGADVQAIVTNDAWFGRSFFQRYQADMVRLRAIEGRTSFIRAANTGISGFVDPRGRYHEMTGLFVEGVAVYDLPVVRGGSVYSRAGDVIVGLAIAGLAVGWSVARRRRSS
jgi:apolipoprotein N-acyltransferase